MNLSDSVASLNHVGSQRLAKLNMLQIYHIEDLILHFPRDYEDRSNVVTVSQCIDDTINHVKSRITTNAENTRINDKIITKLIVSDGERSLEIIWFNQPYLKNNFKRNQEYIFSGKVTSKYNKLQMDSPDYELVGEKESLSTGRIIPVYRSTYKLSQKMIRGLIKNALDSVQHQLVEFLPEKIKLKYSLCERQKAINNIHFPESNALFFEARKRLVFEELFVMQLALLKIKGIIKNKSEFIFEKVEMNPLLSRMPFEMTSAQKKVLEEIQQDFACGFVMNRLIQGDVGSGKTAVAMAACYIAIQNEFQGQAALMVPTEVLARQHYEAFKQYFEPLHIETVLLTGSLSRKNKEEALNCIQSGKSKMIIGTHAVIQEKVLFHNLALVITDEQHRFGVRQRMTLSEKGKCPHVLVMTATPIPRTLALILYGDMDISIINEMPPGRQKIDTYSVSSTYRERIYNFLKKEVDAGRQVYIICPMIEESETLELQAALEYTEKLKAKLSGYSIECLHGKMKQTLKQEVMDRFISGEINMIVSTTVIEVGINVPNASVMVIENAERFGLAQLHQLRGRVGRGTEKSYCVLITDSKSKVCKERMKAMTKSNDGFEISELDLKLRGHGDFFGTMQHGLPELKIANLYDDIDILKEAQLCAMEILAEDKDLEQPENRFLSEEIYKLFAFGERKVPL